MVLRRDGPPRACTYLGCRTTTMALALSMCTLCSLSKCRPSCSHRSNLLNCDEHQISVTAGLVRRARPANGRAQLATKDKSSSRTSTARHSRTAQQARSILAVLQPGGVAEELLPDISQFVLHTSP